MHPKVLILEGKITVREIAGHKSGIQAALEQSDEVRIDLSGISECDLTLVQLLSAASQQASQMNKSLIVTGDIPVFFRAKLQETGFASCPDLGRMVANHVSRDPEGRW